MAERTEYEPTPLHVAVIGCMDEDIDHDEGSVVFGIGGSAITTPDKGNMNLFSTEDRVLVDKLRPLIFETLSETANKLGTPLTITSHLGCGWAKGMGVTPEEMPEVTKQAVLESNVPDAVYAGHIQYNETPIPLDDYELLSSCIVRPPEDHHHKAKAAILTVGGGITSEERRKIEDEYIHGRAFIISADFVHALLQKGIDSKEIERFIKLQLNVAQTIVGEHRPLDIIIHDSHRLQDQSQQNFKVADMIRENLLLTSNS